VRTFGIDLSADPAHTGAAIDVPLGWPDQFVDAVVAHRERSGWPPTATRALVAHAVMRKTTRPCSEQLDAARREGWIHLPTVGLVDLVADSAPRGRGTR
jgi:hypothetical protein